METKEQYTQHIKETLAANFEIILMKSRKSVRDIVEESKTSKTIPDISTFLIHSIRNGKAFPGADKLFVLGELLHVNPMEFLRKRTVEEVSGFLQLNIKEKYIRANLLARKEDNR